MANRKNSKLPVYRAGSVPRSKATSDRINQQHQIRKTAPLSQVYPQVESTLAIWNAATDSMVDLLSQVHSATQQLSELRVRLAQAEAEFTLGERSYRGIVTLVSHGKPELITSLGLPALTGQAVRRTVVTPTGLLVTVGVDPGSAHLKWQAPRGQRSFAVQMSPDPITPSSWKPLDGTSHRTLKVGDLTPGARYWFRVAMIGGGTQSPWTEPVSLTAR